MSESDPTSRARVRRIVRRALVVAAAFLSAGAFAAPTAFAENSLVSSNPADNESLTASPTSMVFTFSEPLGGTNSVAVTCEGAPFSVGQTTVGPDGLTITVPVPNPMPKGTCSAAVAVSAPDGSPNGQFSVKFTITSDSVAAVTTLDPAVTVDPTATTVAGAVATTVAPGSTGDGTDDSTGGSGGPLGLARLVTNIGLAVLFGSLVLIATAWPEGVEYILTVRFLRTAWIVSLVGSVLTAVFLTANVTGKSVGASLSPLAWTDLDSASGIAAIARVLLTAGCVWVVMRPERCIDQSTQLPALAAPLLAVATLGFTRTGGDLAAVGVIMGIGHALAMAVWFGGLALLTRVVLAGPGDDDLVHAVRGFSRISTPALLVTVVTGAVQTFRLDRGALFDTGHGRVLLLKAVAVGAMVFVGLATRQFVNAQLRKVDSLSAPLAGRLRRATGIEAVAGVVVLAITSWLLSFTPPNLVEAAPVGQYGYSAPMVADDLDVTVRLTGVVGRNGVRIEVGSPATGLSNFTVTFIPPAETTAPTVLLTVPAELAGAGVAVLDVAEGVPLEAPGVWTLAIKATTPTGEKTAQKRFTLLGA